MQPKFIVRLTLGLCKSGSFASEYFISNKVSLVWLKPVYLVEPAFLCRYRFPQDLIIKATF